MAFPSTLIDIGRILELRGVRDDGDAIVIGAMGLPCPRPDRHGSAGRHRKPPRAWGQGPPRVSVESLGGRGVEISKIRRLPDERCLTPRGISRTPRQSPESFRKIREDQPERARGSRGIASYSPEVPAARLATRSLWLGWVPAGTTAEKAYRLLAPRVPAGIRTTCTSR